MNTSIAPASGPWVGPLGRPLYALALLIVAGLTLIFTSNILLSLGLALGALLFFLLRHELYVASVLVLGPICFAIDRYAAPLGYETEGYRQFVGVGTGLYLSLGLAAFSRARRSRADTYLLVAVALLGLSLLQSQSPEAPAMFVFNTVPLVGAYFAGRRVQPERAGVVLDAIVLAGAAAVAGRWLLEGPGISESQYRAGTNWYLGAAVYSGLPLLLAWGVALPTLWHRPGVGLRIPFLARVLLVAALSAELVFLQRKTVLIATAVGGVVMLRALRYLRGGLASRAFRVLILAVVIGSLLLLVVASVQARSGRLYGRLWGTESDQERLAAMRDHAQAAWTRPFGYGFADVDAEAGLRTIAAHNTFLDLANDGGIPAATAFVAFVTSLTLLVLRWKRKDEIGALWGLRMRCVVGGAVILVDLLVSGPTPYREFPVPSACLPALFAGLLVACAIGYRASRGGRDASPVADAPLP